MKQPALGVKSRAGNVAASAADASSQFPVIPCVECGAQFRSSVALQAHMRLKHSNSASQRPLTVDTKVSTPTVDRTAVPETNSVTTSKVEETVGKASTSPPPAADSSSPAPVASLRRSVPLIDAIRTAATAHEHLLACLELATHIGRANVEIRSICGDATDPASRTALINPVANDRRPFGGTETLPSSAGISRLRDRNEPDSSQQSQASVSGASARPFRGSSITVRMIGAIDDEPKVGMLKFQRSNGTATADEPCVELTIRAHGYVETTFETVGMLQNFFTVRLHGKHCLSGLRRGDVLDFTGRLGLHPAYDMDAGAWFDEPVLHVRGPRGRCSFLYSVDLPPPAAANVAGRPSE